MSATAALIVHFNDTTVYPFAMFSILGVVRGEISFAIEMLITL